MSAIDRLAGTLSGVAHPRLLVLVVAGAVVGVIGTVLLLAAPGPGAGAATLGLRLGIVGYLVCLLGASGYLAFTVFERGFG